MLVKKCDSKNLSKYQRYKVNKFKYLKLLDDIPLSGIKDSCGYWQKHGFDCVDKVKCNDDGHYSTSPNIAITGIRSQDNDLKFTAQVIKIQIKID